MSGSHVTSASVLKMEAPSAPVVFVVSGIPRCFRSAQLRHYFSQFTESGGFVCFHYRHRPEQRGPDGKAVTFCCPVTVQPERALSFRSMYHGKPWLDTQGNQVPGKCLVYKVRTAPQGDLEVFPYKTRGEAQKQFTDVEKQVTSKELLRMSEFNPPALMAQGNVGTPVSTFLQLIRSCRLPPRLISRLGLQFHRSRRRYGNVPYDYTGTEIVEQEEGVYTATGHELKEGESIGSEVLKDEDHVEDKDLEEESESNDDNDTCEEWERHEALHEDVTAQERCKERLFEEEIELKWEKGGSGLVFYTDAQVWQEEEGDFDEQTADDWDVDMSEYYEPGAGDKDAKDYLKMRLESRRRDGLDCAREDTNGLGSFERHTKGFGRRLLERQGWMEGTGLGASGLGIPDALENEGQNPKCKRGLGYHGEKLSTFNPAPKKPKHLISTIYDEPREEDAEDTLLRRMPSTSMKYRSKRRNHWEQP
ncbi:LOW QUALITY PROTEIN: G patch domain-containing protein 3 [Mantella aurantiaca]